MIKRDYGVVYLSDEVLKVIRYFTAEPVQQAKTVFLKLEMPTKRHAMDMVRRIYSAAKKKEALMRPKPAKKQ